MSWRGSAVETRLVSEAERKRAGSRHALSFFLTRSFPLPKMKLIHSTRTVVIPDDVEIEVKARKVRVKGPRGEFGGREAAEEGGERSEDRAAPAAGRE